MKWIWLAALGFAAPLLLFAVIGLALQQPGLPFAAEQSLDAYLAQLPAGAAAPTVRAITRAAHRSAFTAQQSAAHFGGDYYFAAGDEGRPLPYPPTDLWCVTLSGARAPATVLVAQHEDLYVGAWVVHEPRSAAAAAVCE